MEPTMKRRRILFVDDEPNVLQGLKRMLRTLRAEWEMDFAASAQEALEVLGQKSVDIVVSDMRMPGMNGAEFLTEVMSRFPQVARLALSGAADKEMILRAVRPVHQYLSKPCDAETLKSTIQRLCALRDLLHDEHLKQLTMQLGSVPSLPSLYTELVQELESPDPSIKKVGDIISSDVGMTAKILQMVNSAFFGLRRRVSDPAHAANLLGLDTVKNLVLSIHIFSSCDEKLLPPGFLGTLWHHSLRVGLLAKGLGRMEKAARHCVDDAQGAGMLHDVGKLLLAASLPKKYQSAIALTESEECEDWEAERKIFGTTHAELGGYLLGLWGLVDSVVEAVAFHHEPMGAPATGFTAMTAVHIADAMDRDLRPSCGAQRASGVNSAYIEGLGLSARLSDWQDLCKKLIEETELEEGTEAA